MIGAMRDEHFDRERYDADLAEHGIGAIALADGVPAESETATTPTPA